MFFLGVAVLGLVCLGLPAIIITAAGRPQHEPMDYDEEVAWLMSEGLTEEDAKDIADLPWWR
jgi:hypothetical protein